jgi:hypothetical protein
MSVSGELDFEAKVVDAASSNLDNIKNKMGEVGEAAQTTGTSMAGVAKASEESNVSLVKVGTSLSVAATGMLGLVQSAYNVERAQNAADKANLRVSNDLDLVKKAQDHYNEALAKFGENSNEANQAAKDLKDTQEKLRIDTDNAEQKQAQFNLTLGYTAATIIPQLVTATTGVIGAYKDIKTYVGYANDAMGIAAGTEGTLTTASTTLAGALWTVVTPLALIGGAVAALYGAQQLAIYGYSKMGDQLGITSEQSKILEDESFKLQLSVAEVIGGIKDGTISLDKYGKAGTDLATQLRTGVKPAITDVTQATTNMAAAADVATDAQTGLSTAVTGLSGSYGTAALAKDAFTANLGKQTDALAETASALQNVKRGMSDFGMVSNWGTPTTSPHASAVNPVSTVANAKLAGDYLTQTAPISTTIPVNVYMDSTLMTTTVQNRLLAGFANTARMS